MVSVPSVFPQLLSFSTRLLLFRRIGFGPARASVEFVKDDAKARAGRGTPTRGGSIPVIRESIARGASDDRESFWRSAADILKKTSTKKSLLEVNRSLSLLVQ